MFTHRSILKLSSSGAAIIAALVSFPVFAQSAVENEVRNTAPDEIIVTAQRRSENIQDVPLAVTVFSGASLENQQIRNAEDLIGKIPNFSVQSTLGDTTPIYSIRGVTAWDYSITQNGPIAVYYDEAYKGNFAVQGLNYFDLERVEVLRGPQGTLYGRNTTGGAINFISKKPTFETGGYLRFGYGNYNRFIVEGAVETALSQTLALRIAGTGEWADGWFKNVSPGQPDLASTDQYGFRGTLLFKPNDSFDFAIRASISRANPTQMARSDTSVNAGTGSPYYPAVGVDGNPLLPYPVGRNGLSIRETDNPNVTTRTTNSRAVSLAANASINDDVTLTSITSWDKGDIRLVNDADGAPIRFTEVGYNGKVEQITQDLRLTSSFDGPFNFIIGAYYLNEKLFSSASNAFGLDIDTNLDGVLNAQDCVSGAFFIGCSYTNSFDQKKTSFAAYADSKLNVGEKITFNVGVRYTKDKGRQYNLVSNVIGNKYQYKDIGQILFNIIPSSEQRFSDSDVSGKLGIEYRPNSDLLLYASTSRGYRGASFNAQALFSPLDVSTAKPETITAFEGGFKWTANSGRITLNGALFNYDFKNQQNVDFNSATFSQQLVNIPKSRIRGAEFDISARLIDALSVRSSIGLLDSKTLIGTSEGQDISGKRLVNAPEVTWSTGVSWVQAVTNDIKMTADLSSSYVSRVYFDPMNSPITSQKPYGKLDGFVKFSDDIDRYSATFWMKNITNELIFVDRTDAITFGNYVANVLAPPRTFGVTFAGKF